MAFTKVTYAGIDTSGTVTTQNLNVIGVVTATSFNGNLIGNVTGSVTGNVTGNVTGTATTASSLTGTPNITVGAINASSAVISGNVSVAGTITYEDTTNVDSIGVITARSGIHVTGGAIISGVTTVSAGSTAVPSISPSGDSNTGIFFPTPDTVAIGEGGVEVLRINSSGRVGIGSEQPTTTLDVNGRIKTTEASAVSYASTITGITPQAEYVGGNSNQFFVYSDQAYVHNTGANADWVNMHSFSPEKDGDVTMRASMRITSGSYYFVWRVYEETGNVLFTAAPAGFNAYESPSGQSGNVHNLKMYQWYVPGLKAGKRYNIQMAASNDDGTVLQNGTSQVLIFGRFDITSGSPGYMPGSNIIIPQNGSYSNADVVYYGSTNENSYLPTKVQNFRGTCETFLGWYTMRAYSRYLDIKLNLNSESYMFFFRATGYLYNYGHANDSFYGGYAYTGSQILNKTSSTTNKGFSDVYKSSDGFLCARFDQSGNGYSEGQLAIFFGTHGPIDRGIQVMEYIQNDNATNYFA